MRSFQSALKSPPAKSSALPTILTLIIALLASCCGPVWASSKSEPVYQDGVLVSFFSITTGSSCSTSGTVKGQVNDDGAVSGSTNDNTNCSNNESRRYRIKVGDNAYVLRHTLSGGQKAAALASLGWGAMFMKQSVLANLLPGTPIKARSDGTGFFVKVGKKESRYEVIAAQ
jgi:hypothetical protein